MNALLIHNDNLPSNLVAAFENSLKFEIGLAKMLEDGFSFDKVVHKALEESLKGKQYEAIFIPYSLSNQNYLELSGIRLSLHIRLSPEFKHTKVPIVFMGYETREQIAKLTEFSSFLFTTGVFSTQKLEYASLIQIFNWLKMKWRPEGEDAFLSEVDYQIFISRINIESSSNYNSHHSVNNELTLLRWSEYLKCDDVIPEVKINIKTGLYFKYRREKFPLDSSSSDFSPSFDKQAKVLLIDDEAQKGWGHFYKTFFKASQCIQFNFLDIDFKLNSKLNIIHLAVKEIELFNPDVLLLDLRLCDSDFDPQISMEDLSGFRILESAKALNKGIQVIVITASNQSKVYELSLRKGADYYILKQESSDILKSLKELTSTFQVAIEKAEMLKPIFIFFNKFKILSLNLSEEFRNNLNINLSICFDLLVKSFDLDKYRNYSYLQLFLIIEEFIKESLVFESGINCYVITPSNRYLIYSKDDPTQKNSSGKSALKFIETSGHYRIELSNYKRSLDTNFIMSSILLFRFGLPTSGSKNWSRIYSIRNKKAAHPEVGIVDFSEINLLLNFLEFILDESKINPVNTGLALKELSPKDQIENLKNIWGASNID